jgi:hypothetical protein
MKPQSGVIAIKANTAMTASAASEGLRSDSGVTRAASQHKAMTTAAVPP